MNPVARTAGAFALLLSIILLEITCSPFSDAPDDGGVLPPEQLFLSDDSLAEKPAPLFICPVTRDIRIQDYFAYLDSLVLVYDDLTPYPMTEHLLIRFNAWVIDTLAETDYYRRMERGEFVYDQHQMVVLHKGDSLLIPNAWEAGRLQQRMDMTWLDINIPEFRLRIVEGSDTLYTMKVRVGQNKKRFQQVLNRTADLRTRPGAGQIVRIARAPTLFEDPHTGRRYTVTQRDDGRVTEMPTIPWLEPAINGERLGQMIHPTTNPETLGKAYSNGCIGSKEGDAWRIYYYAPVGTVVQIRYDLQEVTPAGDTIRFPDIYDRYRR
ncbi:MAG: murein L,D-transpeptidase [Bacteroidetes bacterium]|nr:MAG: murein L,D-transpeptidase [Bacteroidota bacterium]